jgi:hypothetical protein
MKLLCAGAQAKAVPGRKKSVVSALRKKIVPGRDI